MYEIISRVISGFMLLLFWAFSSFYNSTLTNKEKPHFDSDYRVFLQDKLVVNVDSLHNLSGERYRLEWDKKTKTYNADVRVYSYIGYL